MTIIRGRNFDELADCETILDEQERMYRDPVDDKRELRMFSKYSMSYLHNPEQHHASRLNKLRLYHQEKRFKRNHQ